MNCIATSKDSGILTPTYQQQMIAFAKLMTVSSKGGKAFEMNTNSME